MKTSSRVSFLLWAGVTFLVWMRGYSQSPGTVWKYQLLEGSRIVDDCPICDRVDILQPVRGSFDLRLVEQTPLLTSYVMENLAFASFGPPGVTYVISGSGFFEISGEVALRQTMFLELWIQNGAGVSHCYFTNVSSGVTRPWPRLQISVTQTNGTMTQQFSLDLNAAPLREMWFSTAQDFTAGIWSNPTNQVRNGEILSSLGRRVKTNQALTASFGIMPLVPDLGLRDFDVLSGGQVAFVLTQGAFSENLRTNINAGDLLSNRGAILRRNEALLKSFAPVSPGPTPKTQGLQVMSGDEVWFTVDTAFHSGALNQTITPGDVLSEHGNVVRSNVQLLSRFNPVAGATNIPVNSFFIWPNGEIWFVMGKEFTCLNGQTYAPGDLLSDQGDRIFSSAEVLSVFSPSPSGTNLTLDALFLVTDAITPSASPIVNLPSSTNRPPASIALSWNGAGKVFQVETASDLSAHFSAAGPISPDTSFIDVGAGTNASSRFYRIRQW